MIESLMQINWNWKSEKEDSRIRKDDSLKSKINTAWNFEHRLRDFIFIRMNYVRNYKTNRRLDENVSCATVKNEMDGGSHRYEPQLLDRQPWSGSTSVQHLVISIRPHIKLHWLVQNKCVTMS